MVDITPGIPDGRNMIDGYGDGGFRVNGQKLEGDYILGMTRRTVWERPGSDSVPPGVSPSGISPSGAALFDAKSVPALIGLLTGLGDPVEVVIIGTGSAIQWLPEDLRQQFRDAGIGVDLMDTGAACRTFNVLMTEGRHAAAALIAVA